jgi:hypothetical protein
VLGSDTWIDQPGGQRRTMQGYRDWLVQFSPEQVRLIAHGNAGRLFWGKIERQAGCPSAVVESA